MAQMKNRWCKACERKTLHVKGTAPKQSGCGNVMLCILTCGLWIPFAILFYGIESLGSIFAPYHCQQCGRKN